VAAGAYYGSYYPYGSYGYGYGDPYYGYGTASYGYDDCAPVPQRVFDGYGYRIVLVNPCGY
jgi:hypothetical protein